VGALGGIAGFKGEFRGEFRGELKAGAALTRMVCWSLMDGGSGGASHGIAAPSHGFSGAWGSGRAPIGPAFSGAVSGGQSGAR
jgi:hypothetical protein